MPISDRGTAYELYGREHAPVVVLIHGIGLSQQIWADCIPVWSKDYRILSYDLPGHGGSQLPTKKPDLRYLSEQLHRLLRSLKIKRCALVGFSIGGMINRRFAMDYPELVSALVILNSPHKRSVEAQRAVEQRAARTDTGGALATIDETLQRWFTTDFMTQHSDKVNAIRQLVLANNDENYTHHRQILAKGVVELIQPKPAIKKPTLVMTCANDTGSTPTMSADIASEIKGAQTIIVPNLKHLGLIEKPHLFSAPILNFLQKE